ncbi:hypothetical protein ACFVWR_02710 [Leifsonia sp. NPDC058292]|uniref:hypothetical protein n=1 Tax=Leifsonia sp. NPDC058292 TaxID=3346428 RepID=UPI0036DC72F0
MIALYAVTATLARSADAGAIVGFVLLATAGQGDAAVAGLLAAALTAPHLAGPLIAPLLDRSAHPAAVLATAFACYALCVGAAAAAFTVGATALSVIALVIAGACGPLLTGGLSSRLAGLVRDERSAQRRAQGMDALTYGLAGTLGPVAIALIASAVTPLAAILVVAAFALVAAALLTALPVGRPGATAERNDAPRPSFRKNLAVLFSVPPLRRVTVGTGVTAFAVGAMPLLAVAAATLHPLGPSATAVLVSAFGVGNLVGSVAMTVRPLRGSPERAVARAAVAIALFAALCALAPTLILAAAAFALTGLASAVQFTSSLAARAEYSPPEARAQVFVTMAGLKVAFSSAGVAIAGIVASTAPLALLVGAAATAALAAALMALDAGLGRLRERRGRSEQDAPRRQAAARSISRETGEPSP